jgi:hypothetical protein
MLRASETMLWKKRSNFFGLFLFFSSPSEELWKYIKLRIYLRSRGIPCDEVSKYEELDGRAVSALGMRSRKLSTGLNGLLGWVTKIYYLELLRASEGTLSCWSRWHLQSLAPTPVSKRVDVRQAAGRKNNCRIFITT